VSAQLAGAAENEMLIKNPYKSERYGKRPKKKQLFIDGGKWKEWGQAGFKENCLSPGF